MAGFSTYFETRLIQWLFKTNKDGAAATALAATGPTNLWVSLHSTDPADVSAGELSGGSYARVAMAKDADDASGNAVSWNISAVSGTAWGVTNKLAVTFPQASADWFGGAAIKWCGLYDASSAGNLLMAGTVNGAVGVVVLSGVTFSFAIGQLAFTAD
jgi:hypothetical protein